MSRFVAALRAITAVCVLICIALLPGGSTARAAVSPGTILVLVNRASPNPFGRYLGEILAAEGIQNREIVELANLDVDLLDRASLVILTETPLSDQQAALINAYIDGGGRLITMRPAPGITKNLGIVAQQSAAGDAYLAIDPATGSGEGFTSTSLPIHGPADRYTLAVGAQSIATLYSDRDTATSFPAVFRFGHTATWTYDLARSVAYARQGDPANAGVDRDGSPPLRTNDVFFNAIDLERVGIPHADIQMRLLSRVIDDLLADTLPLPRLWYFPADHRTLLVLTGDSHANPNSYFEQEIASVESFGGHMTFYISPDSEFPIPAMLKTWKANGHEFGIHPYGAGRKQSLEQGIIQKIDQFTTSYGPPSHTMRAHQVEWQGWADAAKAQAANGINLTADFYTWGKAVTYPDGKQAHGYITGSALPMRMVDESGAIVPVYQQVTSLIDEQLLATDESEKLSVSESVTVSQQLIDRSEAGDYAVIMTQFHVDHYTGNVREWAEATMHYARMLGIPMWTSQHLLDYTETRAATAITALSWDATRHRLRFSISVPQSGEAQSLILPSRFGADSLAEVQIDGRTAKLIQQPITGRATTFVSVEPGKHTVETIYAPAAETPTLAASTAASITTPAPDPSSAAQAQQPTQPPQPTPDDTAIPGATSFQSLGLAILAPLGLVVLVLGFAIWRRMS